MVRIGNRIIKVKLAIGCLTVLILQIAGVGTEIGGVNEWGAEVAKRNASAHPE
jgi:hypothetical protein